MNKGPEPVANSTEGGVPLRTATGALALEVCTATSTLLGPGVFQLSLQNPAQLAQIGIALASFFVLA